MKRKHFLPPSGHGLFENEYVKNGKYNVIFHFNGDWMDAFHSFVITGALIMSKSADSYTDTITSNSTCIYYTTTLE